MTSSRSRRRTTTSLVAPPPPGFTSTLGAYPRGEELRLTADDERVLDEIWAERAARYEGEQATSGSPTGQPSPAPGPLPNPTKRSRRRTRVA